MLGGANDENSPCKRDAVQKHDGGFGTGDREQFVLAACTAWSVLGKAEK